ncbi:hypothetical protein ACT454_001997 [Enterococcus faecium]
MEWIRTAFHIIFIENGLILAILLLSIAVVSNSLVISTQKKEMEILEKRISCLEKKQTSK